MGKNDIWVEQKGDSDIWLPEKEKETIEGVVKDIKSGNYGLQFSVSLADGRTITTPSHKVLQAKLGDFKIGDMIKIVYTGSELPKVKGQNPMKMYQVYKA